MTRPWIPPTAKLSFLHRVPDLSVRAVLMQLPVNSWVLPADVRGESGLSLSVAFCGSREAGAAAGLLVLKYAGAKFRAALPAHSNSTFRPRH